MVIEPQINSYKMKLNLWLSYGGQKESSNSVCLKLLVNTVFASRFVGWLFAQLVFLIIKFEMRKIEK